MHLRSSRRCQARLCSGVLALTRVANSHARIGERVTLPFESTQQHGVLQPRLHPARVVQAAFAGGQMRCRCSSLVCLVIHVSGLRRRRPLTTPSADFFVVFSANRSAPSFACEAPGRSPGVRHVTVTARTPDLQNTSRSQGEDFAVTCPLVTDALRLISDSCSSPRSFGFDFFQTPPRDDALAVSPAFGSAKTWLPDFHRHRYVSCPAHTLS